MRTNDSSTNLKGGLFRHIGCSGLSLTGGRQGSRSARDENSLPSKLERLLEWFQQHDEQLKAWAAQSDTHTQLLLSDR